MYKNTPSSLKENKRKHWNENCFAISLMSHCSYRLQQTTWSPRSHQCFAPRGSRSKRQTVTAPHLLKATLTQNPPVALKTCLPPLRSQHFKPHTWTDWSAPKRYEEWVFVCGTFYWLITGLPYPDSLNIKTFFACVRRVHGSLSLSSCKLMMMATPSNFQRLLATEQPAPSAPGNTMCQRYPSWVWRTSTCQRCQTWSLFWEILYKV